MIINGHDIAGMVVTIDDMRAAGYCVRGIRDWFGRYDFDFRDMLKNGIDAEKFAATEDACALHVVDAKIARERGA